MAPFTPFLTEAIYQNLKKYIRETTDEDTRSIHFISFPDVLEKRLRLDVERKFTRMQKVVDLARNLREKNSIGLKVDPPPLQPSPLIMQVPLRQLIVIHHDPLYLDDIKSVEQYILEELNIKDLVFSSDEEKYGVRYSLVADWPVLGKKLRHDIARVKKLLPSVTSDQVKEFMHNKEITLGNIRLAPEDLQVVRTLSPGHPGYQTHSDQDVFVILDTEIYPELESESLARQVINRIQRFRKKAGLLVTDDIQMQYLIVHDPVGLDDAISRHQPLITKILRRPLEKTPHMGPNPRQIAKEELALNGAVFMLRLLEL